MNKKFIFLMIYFLYAYAIDETGETVKGETVKNVESEYNALMRKSACFCIKHTKKECVIGRPNNRFKTLTNCKHDESLEQQLEDGTTTMIYLYDENKNILDYPAIIYDWSQIDVTAVFEKIFLILDPAIKQKAICGEIVMNQGKPVLSFYDKLGLWVADYPRISPVFFTESKGKFELSNSGKQQLGNFLDLSSLQRIENKTNGAFIPRRFSWDVLNLLR